MPFSNSFNLFLAINIDLSKLNNHLKVFSSSSNNVNLIKKLKKELPNDWRKYYLNSNEADKEAPNAQTLEKMEADLKAQYERQQALEEAQKEREEALKKEKEKETEDKEKEEIMQQLQDSKSEEAESQEDSQDLENQEESEDLETQDSNSDSNNQQEKE